MLQNTADFKDKVCMYLEHNHSLISTHTQVVLDVGAGTGILSFFAVQAGARKVYSIEASSMAVYCLELVKGNRYGDRVVVIAGKVEEVGQDCFLCGYCLTFDPVSLEGGYS